MPAQIFSNVFVYIQFVFVDWTYFYVVSNSNFWKQFFFINIKQRRQQKSKKLLETRKDITWFFVEYNIDSAITVLQVLNLRH